MYFCHVISRSVIEHGKIYAGWNGSDWRPNRSDQICCRGLYRADPSRWFWKWKKYPQVVLVTPSIFPRKRFLHFSPTCFKTSHKIWKIFMENFFLKKNCFCKKVFFGNFFLQISFVLILQS